MAKQSQRAAQALRSVVVDRKARMTTRSEAMAALAKARDPHVVALVEKARVLTPISAYEEIHAPEYARFHKSYLALKMYGLQRDQIRENSGICRNSHDFRYRR